MDFQRLSFSVDTSGLDRTTAALNNVTGAGVRTSAVAEDVSIRLNNMGRTGTHQLRGAANDLQAAARALAQAKAAFPRDWERMSQQDRTRWASANPAALSNYSRAREEMERLNRQQEGLAASAQAVTQRTTMMTAAMGAFAGVMLYQVVGSVASVVGQLASIPLSAARAQDSLTLLSTQLKFAFRGSAEAVRQAHDEIISIARETGVPYQQVAGQYAELAIAGRSAGLSRRQVGGLTDAFTTLGVMTGMDEGRIGRAQWQLQQALAIGRLNGQDYRLMASNMPAIDDVLGEGLGVDANRIFGMVSRGEISAERMVEGIIRGVKILEESGNAAADTMQRARGRLVTEWELTLQDIGKAIRSSEFVQNVTDGLAAALRHARFGHGGGTPQERLDYYREFRDNAPQGSLARRAFQQQIDAARAEIERTAPASRAASTAEAQREAAQDRRNRFNRGLQTASDLDPLAMARGEARREISQLQTALMNSGGMQRQDIEQIERGLAIAEARLAAMMTMTQRFRYDITSALDDLGAYGAGAGFEMASEARSLMLQSANAGDPMGMQGWMQMLLQRRTIQARNQTLASGAALDMERRYMLPAAGRGGEAERLARLELQVAQFSAERFGSFADTPAAQAEIARYRDFATAQSELEADIALRRRLVEGGISIDAARRRLGAIGDPSALRALERQLQRETMNRDLGARAAPAIAQFDEANALADRATLREREAADELRLRYMREEMALTGALGLERRVQLARLERERELRELGIELTREQRDAELARVEANVRIADSLDLQRRRLEALDDAARVGAATIRDLYSSALAEAFRTGTVSGETMIRILQDRAAQFSARILESTIFAPIEKAAESLISRQLGRFTNRATDAAVDKLGEAAADAAGDISGALAGSAVEAGAKLAITSSAAVKEAAVRTGATASLALLTKAATTAAAALSTIGAEQTGKTVAKLFGFASGGVVSRPTLFPFAHGVGLMGEAGAEAILPLKWGRDGRLGVASAGGGEAAPTIVNIIDQRRGGEDAQVSESRGPNGERMVQVLIRDQMNRAVREGALNGAMKEQFGLGQRLQRD